MKTLLLVSGLALGLAGAALANNLLINGAGATFPFPIYSKWFSEYNKLHPDVQINYQSIGSGGGIKQIIERTVDFGATDAPMTDEELKKAPGVVHIPTVMGAVVVVYNLPGLGSLRLSPETLANVFLGKVQNWNDPAIAKDNPGAKLPDSAIAVVHRSDGSGTTAVFTDYRVSITDAPGKEAYPISAFTYLLVYKDQADPAKGQALVHFLWWAIHDGQKMASALDYAPLPGPLVKKVEATLQSITVQGKAVLANRR